MGGLKMSAFLKDLTGSWSIRIFLEEFPSSEVHHLIRQGSDHAPLHLICKSAEEIMVKPFRFLNFWRKHKNFKKIVAENWTVEFAGNPFIEFHAKMKKVKKALTGWSKEAFGNIFQQIATMEDVIKVKEDQLEIQPSASNRADLNKVEAELKKYLRLEEEFWRQKAGMKWFTEGDMNTKFFHSYVKGRRKRLHIAKIVTEQGITLTSNDQIGQAALEFFGEQFRENDYVDDYAMLDHIPRCITEEENDAMCSLPTNEEVKKVVFELEGSSACGPDGFTGHFYQDC
uniref:RNA-directed DNA polymerase (Reverse transcriptase); Ribonuclease H n=1 Tax=Solanum tuberosum TaxID=4113 RepID=M1AL69_SOLTU